MSEPTSTSSSPPLAKACLYYWSTSVWSCVALLAVAEKGYGPDEIDMKLVDINKSENLHPSYLRINPKGTVPCLVVPLEKTLAPGVANRYKSITESKEIAEFLDKSRSVASPTNTTSTAPAPALAPATVALSNTYHNITSLLQSPNVPLLEIAISARNLEELRKKASGPFAKLINSRYTSLQALMDADPDPPAKVKETWERKMVPLKRVNSLFECASKEEFELTEEEKKARETHFVLGNAIWQAEFRRLAATLETEIVGPLCLGDQLSLADLYMTPLLTRLVVMAGGDGTLDGILALSRYANLYLPATVPKWEVGPKLKTWWATMIEQSCWKKLYGNGIF